MNQILQAFKLITSKGVEFLRLFDEHSPYDIASYGIEISLAKEYSKLAEALFGPTNSTRLQLESITLAEDKQLSVNHLLMIDKLARQLDARGAAWKLRAELIAFNGTLEEVKAYGQQRVKELVGESQNSLAYESAVPRTACARSVSPIPNVALPISRKPSTRLSPMMTSHAPKHSWTRSGTTSTATAE